MVERMRRNWNNSAQVPLNASAPSKISNQVREKLNLAL
jgi:hypothetical protein